VRVRRVRGMGIGSVAVGCARGSVAGRHLDSSTRRVADVRLTRRFANPLTRRLGKLTTRRLDKLADC